MADRIDIGVGPRLGFEPTDDSGFTFTPKEELTREQYLSQYVDFSRQTLKPLTGLKEETGIGVDAPEVGQDIDVSLGDSSPETDLVDIYGTIFDNNLQEQVSKSQFGFEETGSSEHASYADYLKTTGNVDRVSDVSNFYAPLANDVLGNISKGKFKDVTFENFDISLDISGAGDRIEKEIKDQLTTKDLGKRGMAAAFSAMGPPIVGSVIGGVIGGTEQLDEFGDPSIRPSGAMGALYDISMARSYDIMNNIKAANNASQYSAVEFGGTGKAGDLGFSAKLGGGQKILRDVGSNAYFKTGGRSHAEAKNIEAFSKGYIVNTFTFDETGGTDFFGNEKNVKVEDAGGVFAGKSGYYTPEGRFYSTRFQTTSAAGPAAAVTTSAKQYGVPEEVMEKAIMDARKGVGTVKGNIDRYKADEKAKADKIEKDKRDKKAAEIARQVEEARKQKEERSRQFSADIYGDDSGGFAAFETSGSYDAGGYSTGDFTGSGGTGTGGGGFTEGGAFSGLAAGGTVGMAAGGAMAAGMGSGFVDRPPSQVPEGQTVADDVETQMPEGAFVINAAAVEFAGEEDIKKMLNDAQKEAVRRGITIDNSKNSAKLIDVAISRGEVTVAPYLAKIIGYDRLNKINNRGKPETKERLQEAAQGGFLGLAEGGTAEYEDRIILDEVQRKMDALVKEYEDKGVDIRSIYDRNDPLTEGVGGYTQKSAEQTAFEEDISPNAVGPFFSMDDAYGLGPLVNVPKTPSLENLIIMAEEFAHQGANKRRAKQEQGGMSKQESNYAEEIRAKRIAFETVRGLLPQAQRGRQFSLDSYGESFLNYIDETTSVVYRNRVMLDLIRKYPELEKTYKRTFGRGKGLKELEEKVAREEENVRISRQQKASGGFVNRQGYASGDKVTVYRGEPIDVDKSNLNVNYGYGKENVGKFHTPSIEKARNFAHSAGPGNQQILSRKVTIDELFDGVEEAWKTHAKQKTNYFKKMPKSELDKNLRFIRNMKKAYKTGERSLESMVMFLQEQVFHDNKSKVNFIETFKNDPKSAGKLAGRAISKVATKAAPPLAILEAIGTAFTPKTVADATLQGNESFLNTNLSATR